MNKALKWKRKAKEILNGEYQSPKKTCAAPVISKDSILFKKYYTK